MRLGVIGHGERVSGVIKKHFREVEPEFRVAGIVDPNEPSARDRLAECDRENVVFYKDLQEMVAKADLDALAIGTRSNLHTSYAIQAARYDLPLYLEKPVAVDMDQAIGLERAFEHSRCPVVVSFPLRVSPLCRLAKEYIDSGAVGSPEHILAINYIPYGTVFFDSAYRQATWGAILEEATHDLDYMMYLIGSNIARVASMATWKRVFGGDKASELVCSRCEEARTCPESPENRKRHHAGGSLEDHLCLFSRDAGTPETGMNEDSSSILVEFGDGRHGVYTQVFYSRRDAAARGATISGYNGTVDFDWYENKLRWVRHHAPFTDTVKAGEGLSHFGGDIELARKFVDIVRGTSRDSSTPIECGLQSAYTCLAAWESARTGQFVKVRQVGQVS